MTVCLFTSCQTNDKALHYLSQSPPGNDPVVFAPGIISLPDRVEFGSIFNFDNDEFYFGVDIDGRAEIHSCKLENGSWSKTKTLFAHALFSFNDPVLSFDESKLYFISDRNPENEAAKKDYDIYYSNRVNDSWQDVVRVPGAVNTAADEYYISLTKNNKMYFSSNIAADSNRKHDFDVYSASLVDETYDKAFRLGGAVNSKAYEADVFIAPDESYIIFSSVRRGGYGRGDLYVSFKNPDGTSTEAINMGLKVNSEGHELCPFVTRDGKYLFYSSKEDIYWVDARILDLYR